MHFQDLSITIELLRTEMISVGIEKGLTAPETVRLSQKLDILINTHQKNLSVLDDRPLQTFSDYRFPI